MKMAIARRTTGKYKIMFPRTNNKNDIVQFLDDMNVERIKEDYSKPIQGQLMERFKETGKPCYALGRFSRDIHTHWVRICFGRETYMIRTDDVTRVDSFGGRMFFKETSISDCFVEYSDLVKND